MYICVPFINKFKYIMRTFTVVLIALLGAVFCKAQSFVNFSDLEDGYVSNLKSVDCVVIGGTQARPCVVDHNNKKIDGYQFTKRLKMPGPGSARGRFLKVHVEGECDVTVYGMAANNDDGIRTLWVAKGGLKDVLNDNFLSNDGTKIGRDTIHYVGEPADLFFFCPKAGFNLYAVKIN